MFEGVHSILGGDSEKTLTGVDEWVTDQDRVNGVSAMLAK